jgi:hypothetical protein
MNREKLEAKFDGVLTYIVSSSATAVIVGVIAAALFGLGLWIAW